MFAYRRTAVRKTVIVNLESRVFKGVLWAKRGPLLVLRNAEMLVPGGQAVPMDGEVVIERAQVEYLQVLP